MKVWQDCNVNERVLVRKNVTSQEKAWRRSFCPTWIAILRCPLLKSLSVQEELRASFFWEKAAIKFAAVALFTIMLLGISWIAEGISGVSLLISNDWDRVLEWFMVFLILMVALVISFVPRRLTHSLRMYMEAHNWCVCPSCGYLLDDTLPQHRCPECGRQYDVASLRNQWELWLQAPWRRA